MSAETSRPVIASAQQAPQRLPLGRRARLLATVSVRLDAVSTSETPR
jgi:hypothetical protein